MIRLILIAAAVGILIAVLATVGVFSHAPKPLAARARANLVVVEKSAHRLTLYAHQRVLRVYTISLGHDGLDPKARQGDGLTPEGRYEIDAHNAHGGFYLSLHISYPSAMDKKVAAARGVAPGGDIMIHGLRNYTGWIGTWQRAIDWTDGCIALTDDEMDEIWRVVPNGTPIEIRH
ncbi:MAG TPA: L,D-transpeptidase family protein [Rhizomicrobium sp.]